MPHRQAPRLCPGLLKGFPWLLSAKGPGGCQKPSPGCHGDPQWLQRVLAFPRLGRKSQLQHADTESHIRGINEGFGACVGALLCCTPCPAPRACLALGSWCSGTHPQGLGRGFSPPKLPGGAARPSVSITEKTASNRNEDQGKNRKKFAQKALMSVEVFAATSGSVPTPGNSPFVTLPHCLSLSSA